MWYEWFWSFFTTAYLFHYICSEYWADWANFPRFFLWSMVMKIIQVIFNVTRTPKTSMEHFFRVNSSFKTCVTVCTVYKFFLSNIVTLIDELKELHWNEKLIKCDKVTVSSILTSYDDGIITVNLMNRSRNLKVAKRYLVLFKTS